RSLRAGGHGPRGARQGPEPMAQIAHTVQPTPARVPARIVQAAALPTRQPLVSHVEVPDLPRAMRAQKVPLPVAAEEASIAHHVERHLRAVNGNADRRLARGAERGGGPLFKVVDADARDVFDAGSRLARSAFAEDGEGHVEMSYHLFRVLRLGRGR